MKLVTPQELLSAADYEEQRIEIRRRIIALKKRRRITVGDSITLVFENRETVLFQIQEMLRTERIFAPDKIQEECDEVQVVKGERQVPGLIEGQTRDSRTPRHQIFRL